MMRRSKKLFAYSPLLLMLTGVFCSIESPARAQNTGTTDGGYRVSESQTKASDSAAPASDSKSASGALRLARFEYISGKVTWRADENSPWIKATKNLPLRQGAQIWVTEGGRAEIRFDDGSLLRPGNDAVVTLQSLLSDSQGEFTQIKLTSGLVTLRLAREHSIYEVDSKDLSIKAAGPARVRIGTEETVEVGVRYGSATVEGKPGKITLNTGDYLDVSSADTLYKLQNLPAEDSWEHWNDSRDRALDAAEYPAPPHYHAAYAPPVWFSLGLSFGPSYHPYWGGRGVWGHRW